MNNENNEEINNNKSEKNESGTKVAKGVGIGVLVCIVLVITVIVGGLCLFVFNVFGFINKTDTDVDKMFDIIHKEMNTDDDFDDEIQADKDKHDGELQEYKNKFYAEIFNSDIEKYNGTNDGTDVKTFLDKVVLKNKKNTNHSISVVFNDETINDNNKIIELKMQIEDSAKYEIIVDYDTNNYINKATIKKY